MTNPKPPHFLCEKKRKGKRKPLPPSGTPILLSVQFVLVLCVPGPTLGSEESAPHRGQKDGLVPGYHPNRILQAAGPLSSAFGLAQPPRQMVSSVVCPRPGQSPTMVLELECSLKTILPGPHFRDGKPRPRECVDWCRVTPTMAPDHLLLKGLHSSHRIKGLDVDCTFPSRLTSVTLPASREVA